MPTVVIGDNTGDDYSGTEDAGLKEGSPTTNFGVSSNMGMAKYGFGDHQHGLFSFSGISNLPSSLTVTSAIVSLYLNSASGGTHSFILRRLLRNWVEGEATWNIWSTGNSWSTSGGISDGNDRSATTSDTISSVGTTTGQYYDSDDLSQMQSDVEDFADGTLSNYGWHGERSDGADDSTSRVWRTSDADDGERPYLTVVYSVGAAGIQPLRRREMMRRAA